MKIPDLSLSAKRGGQNSKKRPIKRVRFMLEESSCNFGDNQELNVDQTVQENIFKQPSQASAIDLEPLASLELPDRNPREDTSKVFLKIHQVRVSNLSIADAPVDPKSTQFYKVVFTGNSASKLQSPASGRLSSAETAPNTPIGDFDGKKQLKRG